MASGKHTPRAYLRHPTDIPIHIHAQPIQRGGARRLMDVGLGGLACRSEQALEVGTPVDICIELVSPPFQAEGRIAWCRHCGNHHELGIQFLRANDAFTARMVEQLCHIEQYRQDTLRREGRVLDGRSAALEWIARYADRFPPLNAVTGAPDN